MRTDISAPVALELVKPTTLLGYLVELTFSGVNKSDPDRIARICTYGDLHWNSVPWPGCNATVTGFTGDSKSARVMIFDADASWRTLGLSGTGVRNKRARVWKVYVNALGAADPVQTFEGVGDDFHVSPGGRVEIGLSRQNAGVLYAPRKRITASNGFNFLAAAGSTITWGNQQITLNGSNR